MVLEGKQKKCGEGKKERGKVKKLFFVVERATKFAFIFIKYALLRAKNQ